MATNVDNRGHTTQEGGLCFERTDSTPPRSCCRSDQPAPAPLTRRIDGRFLWRAGPVGLLADRGECAGEQSGGPGHRQTDLFRIQRRPGASQHRKRRHGSLSFRFENGWRPESGWSRRGPADQRAGVDPVADSQPGPSTGREFQPLLRARNSLRNAVACRP